ncbi:MAG: malate/lactate/ureidoglycolate dehydrogenase [Acidobacteriota bacterium]
MNFSDQSLTRLATAVLTQAGADPVAAAICAAHLVEANLKGHDSHGVQLLPAYVRWISDGRVFPNRHASITHDRGAVVAMDGEFGLGQVVGLDAVQVAIERARRLGIACVGLRNAGHLGRIGAYAEACAEAGLVSMHYVNVVGHAPTVAPFGGRLPRMVTNPYCCAVPRPDGRHVVVDFATSAVSIGKIRTAYMRGERAPEHALVDADGHTTTDPGTLFTAERRGHLLPFGQHKGGGLQILCELLGGALAGHWTIRSPGRADYGATINNMLSIVLDPDAFGGRDHFEREVTAMVDGLRDTPPAAGFECVQLPGDPERAAMAERRARGIDIDDNTWASLTRCAVSLGIAETALPTVCAAQNR